MWGNLQGWIIAAVLGLLLSFGLFQLATYNRVSIPTPEAENPLHLKPITFAISPNIVTPMADPRDAKDLYRLAIEDIRKSPDQYEAALTANTLNQLSHLKSVKLLLDASSFSKMTLLTSSPKENIGYFPGNISPDLADIEKAGLVVEQIGLLHFNGKNYEEAKKHFHAEFSLGYKLFNERITYKEAEKGIAFMRASVQMLLRIATIEKNENRFRQFSEFDAELSVIFEQLKSLWLIIYAIDERIVAAHVGDVFLYASEKMQERMWRIEAILKIGRFKYNVGGKDARLADQQAADQMLKSLEKTETDPVLLAAIRAAQNITLEQFRAIQ